MRHGLQRQTLMCASVIKCDLVSGIPPPANYGGVSLSPCHCSHQRVGEPPYRLILAFSAAVPRLDCDSPQQRGPREHQTRGVSRRSRAIASDGFVTHSSECAGAFNNKVLGDQRRHGVHENIVFGPFVVNIVFSEEKRSQTNIPELRG